MMSYGIGLRTTLKPARILLAGFVLVLIWEVASRIVQSDTVLPGVVAIASSFKGLSNYWSGGLGIEATKTGAEQTYIGAVLALADNGLDTTVRLLLGMALGFTVGLGGGLAIGYLKSARRFAYAPVILVSQLPIFALLPLFQFWFGPTGKAAIWFVTFGAGMLIIRMTINAVENVPAVLVQSARTMGASSWRIYRSVIVPAIIPEMRGAVSLALTLSWTLVLGGELLGVESGLGNILVGASRFADVGQMVFIAAMFVILAGGSFLVFNTVADRVIQWTE